MGLLLVVAAAAALAALVLYDTPADVPVQRDGAAVVWAVGDGADGGEAAMEVAGMMAEGGIDRLLYLGDVYETGSFAEFESNYASVYGRFNQITEPTPGNHEWPSADEGYFPYWRQVKGEPQPEYYSFELAGWEIISLNSEPLVGADPERLPGSATRQLRWLRQEVEDGGDCRLAFWHTPRYSAGTTHGDDPSIEPFWRALRNRARVVVNGHDHDMQRLEPIDGITVLISGAGGHGLYSVDPTYRRLAFGNSDDYGALRLELEPGVARHSFVASDGRTLDSGTVSCDPGRRGNAD